MFVLRPNVRLFAVYSMSDLNCILNLCGPKMLLFLSSYVNTVDLVVEVEDSRLRDQWLESHYAQIIICLFFAPVQGEA